MPIANVYSFITAPFRYSNQVDAAVRATYPLARQVEMDSTLTNLADADAVAATLFNILKAPRFRFEVEVLGLTLINPDMFDGAVPCATLSHPRFNLSAGRLVAIPDFDLDLTRGVSILRCWG
jgi:hypothetical protein